VDWHDARHRLWPAIETASRILSHTPRAPEGLEQLRHVQHLVMEVLQGGRPNLSDWAVQRAVERRIDWLERGEYPPDLGSTRDFSPHHAMLAPGDRLGVEAILLFLEADPWHHSSGYLKEYLIEQLLRVPLTGADARRAQRVVLQTIAGRDRREFRRYCRLARHVADAPFRAEVDAHLADRDPMVRRHAQWVHDAIEGKRQPMRHWRWRRGSKPKAAD
jgi:hypothetical protein